VREWKDLLYRHRMKQKDYSDSEYDGYRRPMNSKDRTTCTLMLLTCCRTIRSTSHDVRSATQPER
jgi:hypothetical protein